MQVKEFVSSKLREKYYEIEHSSGLRIFVMPKEGYNSTYAIIGTPFGSINTEFDIKEGRVRVPDGIAQAF